VEAASIKKAKTVSNENITEELKILGLFKTMDGKYDEYPQ
jgi:hypothetical protein